MGGPTPFDKREDTPKDFWYPIPLALATGEKLPGKLWSCRCPRDVENPKNDGAEYFMANTRRNKPTKVICLLEEHEDIEYAKVPNLAEWYSTMGMEMERFPIKDYDVPKSMEAMLDLL